MKNWYVKFEILDASYAALLLFSLILALEYFLLLLGQMDGQLSDMTRSL